MNRLTAKDKEQLVQFLDSWLKTWAKNKEKSVYGTLWDVFRQMKDHGIENNAEYKQLGGFGLYLLSIILYSFQEYWDEDIREESEPRLIECIIAFHLLIRYMDGELGVFKISQDDKNTPYRKRNIEFENRLFSFLPKKFHNHFKKQISSNDAGYWQTLSEMRTMALFHKLGLIPKEVNVKTVKGKNVDFISEYKGESIHVEVKGFAPENYQTAKRPRSFDAGEESIERALKRSQNKFIRDSYNIVVIADEETTRTTLFMNPLLKHHNTPLAFLRDQINKKTSALIILGGLYENQLFKFMLWYNPNAQKDLPQGLKRIFDQNKVKKNERREN